MLKISRNFFIAATEFDIEDSFLSPEEKMPDELSISLKIAHEQRPEFVQLKEGLNAKKAIVTVERSGFYPQLFLGAHGYLAGATNRDRLRIPTFLISSAITSGQPLSV